MGLISFPPRFFHGTLWVLTISCLLQPCMSFMGTSSCTIVTPSPFVSHVRIPKEIRQASKSRTMLTASVEEDDQIHPPLLQEITSDTEKDLEESTMSPLEYDKYEAKSLSPYEFQRSLLETRLKLEATTNDKAEKNEVETSDIETIDYGSVTESASMEELTNSGETMQNPQLYEEKDFALETNLQETNIDLEIPESTIGSLQDSEVTSNQENVKKEKKSMIWQEVSPEDISSRVIESLTPEKGLSDLANESDGEVLQFAASRMIEGILEGGKAAIWGIKAIKEETSDGPALALAGEATKKLVSSFTAFTTLGFRAAKKAQELAQKAQVELALAAEARRKKEEELEEERKRMEEKRLQEEQVLMEQRKLAEEERSLQEALKLNSEKSLEDNSLPTFAVETETITTTEPSTFRAFFADEI